MAAEGVKGSTREFRIITVHKAVQSISMTLITLPAYITTCYQFTCHIKRTLLPTWICWPQITWTDPIHGSLHARRFDDDASPTFNSVLPLWKQIRNKKITKFI